MTVFVLINDFIYYNSDAGSYLFMVINCLIYYNSFTKTLKPYLSIALVFATRPGRIVNKLHG